MKKIYFLLILLSIVSSLKNVQGQSCPTSQVHFYNPIVGYDKIYTVNFIADQTIPLDAFTPGGGTLGEDPGDTTTHVTYESSNTAVANMAPLGIRLKSIGQSTIKVHYNDDPPNCKTEFTLIVQKAPIVPSANNILYVNKNVSGGIQSGNSWANAIQELRDALQWAKLNWDGTNGTLQIWVAQGLYTPVDPLDLNSVTDNEREKSFSMINNVQIYGGLAGTEPASFNLNNRDWESHPTIISGDIDRNDTTDGNGVVTSTDNIIGNNSYRLFNNNSLNSSAVLDGITITGGKANGSLTAGEITNGGGMYNGQSSPTLKNINFSGNYAILYGGGMINSNVILGGVSSNPKLTNVIFNNNTANDEGGGIWNDIGNHPFLKNITFNGNKAGSGGGMYNNPASHPTIINSIFKNNIASVGAGMCNMGNVLGPNEYYAPNIINTVFYNNKADGGGAITNLGLCSPQIINSTFIENSAEQGGGAMVNLISTPKIINSILWNNSAEGSTTSPTASIKDGSTNQSNTFIANSIIANSGGSGTNWNTYNGIDGGGNLDVDPKFFSIDPQNIDFLQLSSISPAMNSGSNQSYTDAGGNLASDIDLAGNPRLYNGAAANDIIDMGAYEFQAEPSAIIPSANNTLYVSKNVSGSNQSGNSWENAIPELADALVFAKNNENLWTETEPLQIWVAIGTYKPLYSPEDANFGNPANRDNTFLMVKNVQLYGGFDPNNGITALTDTRIFPSITPTGTSGSVLSGDIGTLNDNSDNVYHVAVAAGSIGNALINGFSIEKGGIETTSGFITINGIPLYKRQAGGIYIANADLRIENTLLQQNTGYGATAIYNETGSVTLLNSTFVHNRNDTHYAATILNSSGEINLNNTTFSSNYSSFVLYNGTLGSLNVYNSVLWNNEATINKYRGNVNFQNSLVESYSGGINNIDEDPLFTDPINGNYTLQPTSPAVGTGSNQLYTNAGGDLQNDVDLAGKPRLQATNIDMGALETADTPPTAICANYTAQLDASGMVTINPEDIDNGSSDTETEVTLSLDIDTFDCSKSGNNTVTLTVEDASGNTATCTATVTVVDNVAPSVNCAAPFTIQLGANGEASITVNDIDSGSTDNCAIDTLSIDITNFDCSHLGDNSVTLTVTDTSGNTGSCTTTVTVADTMAPSIACPADITVSTDAGNCSATVNFATPLAMDNCSVDTLVQTDGPASGSQFPVGVTLIGFTATDTSGNTSSCTFNVTVGDNEAPIAICQNITVQLDEFGLATISAADLDGGSSDACGIDLMAIGQSTFDCTNVGDNNVLFTVTDINGNASSCTAIVTVQDVTAPQVSCQDITVQLDAGGAASITGANIDNGSTDACGIATYSLDMDTFDCSNIGENTVTLTVTDVNGNSASCSATVTVEDLTAPELACSDFTLELGADGTATLLPANVIATGTDACGIATTAVDITEFDCSDIGTPVTVQVFASDINGNISTCSAVVTVVDAMAPIVSCPADQTVDPGIGNLFYEVPDYFAIGEASAIDNCTDPATITSQEPAAGEFLGDGVHIVTLSAEDGYGNIGTCTFELTVKSVLGMEVNTIQNSLHLYPNPATNKVTLENPSLIKLNKVIIYDLMGRMVKTIDLQRMGASKTIDISNLASASYLLRISTENSYFTKILIKE